MPDHPRGGRMMCARCRLQPRLSQMTGCLCEECEDEISGMTQSELDADYEAHARGGRAGRVSLAPCPAD